MKNVRFEKCFKKYKNLVYRIAWDKTGDFTVAEDLTQKVFVALYEHLDHVKPEFEKAWLIRCTKNALIDHYRKNRSGHVMISDASLEEDGNALVEESMELYEERMIDRELTGKIFREIRHVNEQWYEALVACLVDGLSYSEAAKKLHITAGVLRGRIYRAKAYIREKFSEEYEERKE